MALLTYSAGIRSLAGNRTRATWVGGRCPTMWPTEHPVVHPQTSNLVHRLYNELTYGKHKSQIELLVLQKLLNLHWNGHWNQTPNVAG